MAGSTSDQIVAAADDLFYRQGYEQTSFADIAGAVKIARGNLYHHFKTKDAILEAVLVRRLASTEAMLERWEAASEAPADRLCSFAMILIANQSKIMAYGCPVGTLCSELAKLDHPAKTEADGLFGLFHAWLRLQFERLNPEADANAAALHLLARSQGVATLANAFKDEAFVAAEVDAMRAYIHSVARQTAGADS